MLCDKIEQGQIRETIVKLSRTCFSPVLPVLLLFFLNGHQEGDEESRKKRIKIKKKKKKKKINMKLNQMMMMVVMDGNGGGEYGTDGKQPQVPQPKQLTVLFPERRSLKLSRAVHGDLRRLKLRHFTSFTLVKKSVLRSQMAKASRAKKDGTFFAGPEHGAGPIHQRNRWDCEVWMILWVTGWWYTNPSEKYMKVSWNDYSQYPLVN